MMRYLDSSEGDLLLARGASTIFGMTEAGKWVNTGVVKPFPIYRYRPGADTFVAANEETWELAAGEIADCSYYPPGFTDLVVNSPKYRLELRRRPIPTVAPLAVGSRLSRSGQLAAVLSGEDRSVSLMPFISGGTAKGQHYVQVLNMKSAEFWDGAIRIPLISEGGLSCCWSPDDRYIVYYNGAELAIVQVAMFANSPLRE